MLIHLVIADSHPIVLDGMKHLFRQEEDFRLAARCTDGLETMQAIRLHRPDVVIMDIRMPGRWDWYDFASSSPIICSPGSATGLPLYLTI